MRLADIEIYRRAGAGKAGQVAAYGWDDEVTTDDERPALDEALVAGTRFVDFFVSWGDTILAAVRRGVTIRFPFPWDEEEAERIEIAEGENIQVGISRIEDGETVLQRIRDVPEAERTSIARTFVVYRGAHMVRPDLPTGEEGEGLEAKLGLQPIPCHGAHTLTLDELYVWLAINEARDEGDEERARRYYDALYRAEPKAAPMVQNYSADYVYYSTSKTMEETFAKITAGAGHADIDVKGRNEKRPVVTLVRWEAETGLTAAHKAAYEKIMDFYRAGLPYYTLRQLAAALAGKDSGAEISRAAIERAAEWSKDLTSTLVWLDASTELARYPKARGLVPVWNARPIVPAFPVILKDKHGKLCEGYEFIAGMEPPLYAHDMAIGQYTALPMPEFRRISGAISMTPAAITIRDYLIQRIQRMTTAQTSIQYSAIAEQTGNRAMKARDLREKVARLLDEFKAVGRIAGWSEYSRNGKVVGVRIRLKIAAAQDAAEMCAESEGRA